MNNSAPQTTPRLDNRIVAALFAICGIGVVFFLIRFVTVSREQKLLVNYVPQESELWLWHGKESSDQRFDPLLQLIGAAPFVSTVLGERNKELIAYRSQGEWYKITRETIDDAKPTQNVTDLWEGLIAYGGEHQIIGYISPLYAEHLIKDSSNQTIGSGYYFTAQSHDVKVSFSVIPADHVSKIPVQSSEYPYFDDKVFFAFSSEDDVLNVQVREYIEEVLKESIASRYPVIVSRRLPDGTAFKEERIDPSVFEWVPAGEDVYRLQIKDMQRAWSHAVTNEEITVSYFMKDTTLIVASDETFLLRMSQGEFPLRSEKLLYVFFDGEDGQRFVDSLGKSEALRWLQDLQVKRMIVTEDEQGVIHGELFFNTL